MDINDYMNANLHLPKPLRTHQAQLNFIAFFYKLDGNGRENLFRNITLNDLAYYTFNVYFREMFSFGYVLSTVRIKGGIKPLPLDTLVERLIQDDYVNIALKGSTDQDYERVTSDLVYSANLDKYRKDMMYMPFNLRDFHYQKSLFRLLNDKHSKANISVPWISAHMFITDYIHHYLAYSGLVLRKSRQRFHFKDMDEEINHFEQSFKSSTFPV